MFGVIKERKNTQQAPRLYLPYRGQYWLTPGIDYIIQAGPSCPSGSPRRPNGRRWTGPFPWPLTCWPLTPEGQLRWDWLAWLCWPRSKLWFVLSTLPRRVISGGLGITLSDPEGVHPSPNLLATDPGGGWCKRAHGNLRVALWIFLLVCITHDILTLTTAKGNPALGRETQGLVTSKEPLVQRIKI